MSHPIAVSKVCVNFKAAGRNQSECSELSSCIVLTRVTLVGEPYSAELTAIFRRAAHFHRF